MSLCRILLWLVWVAMPTAALAQPPYAISGLHTDLILTQAVAQAKKLGGDCQDITSHLNQEPQSVQCDYSACVASNSTGLCEAEGFSRRPMIASQAISRIVLEAPGESARLTRIVMAYEGDTEAVAAGLVDEFGPTDAGGGPTGKTTWSNARRWNWTQGRYRMGLLDSPQLIILATDQLQVSPAGDTQPPAVP